MTGRSIFEMEGLNATGAFTESVGRLHAPLMPEQEEEESNISNPYVRYFCGQVSGYLCGVIMQAPEYMINNYLSYRTLPITWGLDTAYTFLAAAVTKSIARGWEQESAQRVANILVDLGVAAGVAYAYPTIIDEDVHSYRSTLLTAAVQSVVAPAAQHVAEFAAKKIYSGCKQVLFQCIPSCCQQPAEEADEVEQYRYL
jgi:hypothetical protein